MRREKCELCVLSWNVQRVSGGLSMLVQQISEIEEWDAILLQELSFNDELLSLDELEASLGGHNLVTNAECPWDTAIIIHCRWMGFIRWFASSPHAVWVGVRAEEEFTFCSAHLPSWVSDECFEQSVEEVLETGRSKASGSISWESMPIATLMTVVINMVCWSENCVLCIICFRCSSAFGRCLGSLQQESCGRRNLTSVFQTRSLQKLRLQKFTFTE